MPKPKDIRDVILEKMQSEGRTLTWLASEIDVNYHTLYSCLRQKTFHLSAVWLKKINKALETDYELTAA